MVFLPPLVDDGHHVGDGQGLACLELGLGHPPPGHHVDDGRPPAPLQAGLAHDDLIGYVLGRSSAEPRALEKLLSFE